MPSIKMYKVVRNVSGQYFSALITGARELEYIVDTDISAPLGKLFVFRDKAHADAFVGSPVGIFEVWECECWDVENCIAVLPDSRVENADNGNTELQPFKNFWDKRFAQSVFPAPPTFLKPPQGSFLAASVRLTRLAP